MKISITKMTVAISAMMLSILICTSAYASDYKPMIRYDRVWEAVCSYHQGPEPFDLLKCMKFTGTEEIQGKTYHRLATFKKYVGKYDSKLDGLVVKEVYEDIDEHEGYMREEEGVVYTLVFDNGKYRFDDWWNFRYVGEQYIPGQVDGEGEISEYAIYDFNHKEGEVYNGLTMYNDIVHPEEGKAWIKMNLAETVDFEVAETSTAIIDGEECREIGVRAIYTEGRYHWVDKFIEGIGATLNGCLNFHWFAWDSNLAVTHNFINRVYNYEGDIIYTLNYPKNLIFDEVSVDGLKDTQSSSSQMYDMLGRRIYYPAPGQIYIRDGKKHVAGLD